MSKLQLTWEIAPAYDMLLSLNVLHNPSRYGLRGAWAAGVRSRLPEEERETFQQAASLFIPFRWLHSLSEPKNGRTVLEALAALPAEKRLETMVNESPPLPADVEGVFRRVAERGSWGEDDFAVLHSSLDTKKGNRSKKDLQNMLQIWSQPERFGERYLRALRAYHDAFFAEEEARILPYLNEAVEQAQELAEELTLVPLLEALSQGLEFRALPELSEITLAPSFWITPLVAQQMLGDEHLLFVYGARPSDVSLVPGETVPEDLHRALKALADPTRLRILYYLASEPLSPTQLSKRLRLRAPTVVHHLYALRLARLVQLSMEAEGKRRYALRPGAIESTFEALQHFIDVSDEDTES